MCGGASLAATLPSMVHQLRAPSPKGLLLGMANSAIAFFLFSYQVHYMRQFAAHLRSVTSTAITVDKQACVAIAFAVALHSSVALVV